MERIGTMSSHDYKKVIDEYERIYKKKQFWLKVFAFTPGWIGLITLLLTYILMPLMKNPVQKPTPPSTQASSPQLPPSLSLLQSELKQRRLIAVDSREKE